MTVESYNAQRATYNLTIQSTVAASMAGVSPEKVTNIVVGAAADVPVRVGSFRGSPTAHAGGAVAQSCSIAYTVTVNDPLLTFEALRDQLVESAASGQMDAHLHHYADVFGVSGLVNGTFTAPQVTNAAPHVPSEQMTGAQIAGIVVGAVMGVVLYHKSQEPTLTLSV